MKRVYAFLLTAVMLCMQMITYAEEGATVRVSDIDRIVRIVESTLDEGEPVQVSVSGSSRQQAFNYHNNGSEVSEIKAWTEQQKDDATQFLKGIAQYFSAESSAEEFEKATKDGTYHYEVGLSLKGKFFGHWSTTNIYSLYLHDHYLRIYNDFSESAITW